MSSKQTQQMHPESPDTPLWRKVLFALFSNHGRCMQEQTLLKANDIWELPDEFTSQRATEEFQRGFDGQSRGGIARAIWGSQRRTLAISCALQLCSCVADLASPLLLYEILNLVIAQDYDAASVHVCLVLLFATAMLQIVFRCHSHFYAFKASLKVVGALRTLIFESTIASPSSQHPSDKQKKRMAEITHMYLQDVWAVGSSIVHMHLLWRRALQILFEMTILVQVVKIEFVVIAITLAAFCIAMVLKSVLTTHFEQQWSKRTQVRLNTVHECFKGIQMVKLNAWEDKMLEKIGQARANEHRGRWIATALRMLWFCLSRDMPNLVSIFIFSWMAIYQDSFPPARVFTALLLFQRIKVHLFGIVSLANLLLSGSKAVRRIEAYLRECSSHARRADPAVFAESRDPSLVVAIERASFSPSPGTTKPLLINVNVSVHRGQLVIVHGKAGAGKSTLLGALLGDVNKLSGDVHFDRESKVAYCSQEPWLQTLTIRDNILFGAAFDEHKYWCVLDACCLTDDLLMLPDGDGTKVGPKGVNLSGGQKARIALARACYADAEVYLLDCPFSSVDAIVQSNIFTKCIVELLRFKTVVLVTHNQEIVSSTFADSVFRVDRLRVQQTAKPKASKSGGVGLPNRQLHGHSLSPPWKRTSRQAEPSSKSGLNLYELPSRVLNDMRGIASAPKVAAASESSTAPSERFSMETVRDFFLQRDSLRFLIPALAVMVLFGVTSAAKDLWLMTWSANSSSDGLATSGSGKMESERYAFTYSALVVASLTTGVISALLLIRAGFDSANRLFDKMTLALLYAPMTFFYSTPIGEIFNRYLTDVNILDGWVSRQFLNLLRSAVSIAASAVIVLYCAGFAGVLVLLVVGFFLKEVVSTGLFVWLSQLSFQTEAANLNFISEALDGATTIRAFGVGLVEHFRVQHGEILDELSRGWYLVEAFENFVLIRSGHVHGLYLLLLAYILAFREISPATLGLLLYYLLTLQSDTLNLSNGFLDAALTLVNVERVREFGRIVAESDVLGITPSPAPAHWPERGEVVFERVWFGYSRSKVHEDCSVMGLRDVSFTVRGGEKIGVVGRTGSGKSSLAMALFRVHNLTRGRILIDGVDLCSLSLVELRKRMCIIPQTPMFYRCSVRSYLDPFGEFDDGQLWNELIKCGLEQSVERLDVELWDNGENWSMGERQMLCLARALLKPSRVVILDESFSSVDASSEDQLIEILDANFQHSTVFLITHRLDQVLRFDKIMVMQAGELVEFGAAEQLAADGNSVFYEFLETTLLTL